MAKIKKPHLRTREARPWLAACVITERVLEEGGPQAPQSGVVPSLIRVIDKVAVPAEAIAQFFKPGEYVAFNLMGFFGIRAGEFRGKCVMSVYQETPSGQRDLLGQPMTLTFDSTPDQGFNIKMPIALKWDGPGRYRLDLLIDNKSFGRAYLTVEVGPANHPVQSSTKAK